MLRFVEASFHAARPLVAGILLLGLLGGAGCSSGEPVYGYGDEDADAVASSISVLSDFADRPKRFEPLFVEGAAPPPDQREKFGSYAFATVERPEISGETGTARVEIRDENDKLLGIATWTAVKQNGKWKLKDTPLQP